MTKQPQKQIILDILAFLGHVKQMPQELKEKTIKLVIEHADHEELLTELKKMLEEKLQADDVAAMRALQEEAV